MVNIFTIGHGRRKSSEFLSLLKVYNIDIVVDVRSIPFSRFNPQYNRKQLATDLKLEGIEYLFLGDSLGGRPKNLDFYTGRKLNYSLLKSSAPFKEGIQKICNLISQDIKVTLMCSESDPDQCHRKRLLSEEFVLQGLNVCHIDKTGTLRTHLSQINGSIF